MIVNQDSCSFVQIMICRPVDRLYWHLQIVNIGPVLCILNCLLAIKFSLLFSSVNFVQYFFFQLFVFASISLLFFNLVKCEWVIIPLIN